MKEIERDCNCAFQSSFLLFVKFDITLGKHYRLKQPGEIKNTVYAFFLGEGGGGGGGGSEHMSCANGEFKMFDIMLISFSSVTTTAMRN